MLSRTEKDALYKILDDKGIPRHLLAQPVERHNSYKLPFKEGPYYFKLIPHLNPVGTNHGVVSTPRTKRPRALGLNWQGVESHCSQWADYIVEELRASNLWREAIFQLSNALDEKFTDHELRELQSQLRAVEHKLTASGLPEAAIKKLTPVLRDAGPKAEGRTKKEWQDMFLNAVAGALAGLALSEEHVQTMYQILKATFTGWLLH